MSHFKVIICLSLVFVLFASCGKSVISSEVDIIIWHWMPEKQKTFENLAKKYLQETGIRVVFKKYYPKDVYRNKVLIAQTSNELPEIFNPLAGKREVASFIQEGVIANLSKDLNEGSWREMFFSEALLKDYYESKNDMEYRTWNL